MLARNARRDECFALSAHDRTRSCHSGTVLCLQKNWRKHDGPERGGLAIPWHQEQCHPGLLDPVSWSTRDYRFERTSKLAPESRSKKNQADWQIHFLRNVPLRSCP